MFQAELESMSADERASLQIRRLKQQVERLRASTSDYWKLKLDGLAPQDLRSMDEVEELPFTEKSEFRRSYPYGMLTVPLTETVRLHASSGTSGKPTVAAYTASDVGVFAEVNARAIACAGGVPEDVLHVAYGYGLFTGGLGLHYGGERLGATVVPASGGNSGFQIQLLEDLGARGLCCTPSFGMLLAERAAQRSVTGAIRVRYGVFGAEPWSESFRHKLEHAWSQVTGETFDACDIYGLSEIIGPGVAMECRENKGGLHVFDDHFYPEIIDPDTGCGAEPGERGELVLTTLTKEALPVLRYRTGDVTRLVSGDCPCGRTHPRIGRLEGRVDDMLVIRGINVFPREIEAIVLEEQALSGAYAIVVDKRETLAKLEVRAELGLEFQADEAELIARRLEQKLLERLRLRVGVVLGTPGSLPRTEVGKARRVFERTSEEDPVPAG